MSQYLNDPVSFKSNPISFKSDPVSFKSDPAFVRCRVTFNTDSNQKFINKKTIEICLHSNFQVARVSVAFV